MKTIPSAMATALAAGATRHCFCWKVTRTDDTVLGFTDHDQPVTIGAVTYQADSGFTASEIESSLGLSVDNLDVEGALSSSQIAEADIRNGLYDGADVEIWRVDWEDTDNRVLLRKGTVGNVTRGAVGFVAELRGLADLLDQTAGRTFQRACDADVGDSRCTVDLDTNTYRGTATVVSSTDDRIITVASFSEGSFDDHWFRHGKLTWTSGDNDGGSAEVRAHYAATGGIVIELWQRAPLPIEAGDTFQVRAGCDKTFATCKAKFSNGDNFRGFPHMPGNDRAFSYVVGTSGENDGGSFFNDSGSGGGFGL